MTNQRANFRRAVWAFGLIASTWGVGAEDLTYQILHYPNSRETRPTSIDAQGVAGEYVDGSYSWRAFYWDGSTFTSPGKPGALQTLAAGTSGGAVVGRYQYAPGNQVPDPMRAYYTKGSTWVDLIPPGAVSDMDAVGVSGNLVTGSYRDAAGYVHGFLWNGSQFQSFDALGSAGTWPVAISGNRVIGKASNGAFYWDGVTFTPVLYPGSSGTWVYGLHEQLVVGVYGDGTHGFIWNTVSYVAIDVPGAVSTTPSGVFNGNVVGYYSDGTNRHGFSWDGANYTLLDVPGATATRPVAIWGNRVTGQFTDAQGLRHGFVTVLPAPYARVELGSTNVFSGQEGQVPLIVTANARLTNITAVIEVAETWLTNLVLQVTASDVVSASLTPLLPNHLRVVLNLNPVLVQTGRRQVAQLSFRSVVTGHSGIVPLGVSELAATLADGKAVGRTQGIPGRVVVVQDEPVLTVGEPPWMSVVLYGHSGASYDLESTPALPAASWKVVRTVTLSGPSIPLDGLGLEGPASFYRARQK